VLIDVLRRVDNPAVRAFLRLAGSEPLVIGDIVLLEVLQGTSSDSRAQSVEGWLRAFGIVPMLTEALAVRAAGHYRRLRGLGITPRSTTDLLIATWCIAHAVPLLHRDRDFSLMAEPLGLPVQAV
jgi:predicted nucleic acid-binding protein